MVRLAADDASPAAGPSPSNRGVIGHSHVAAFTAFQHGLWSFAERSARRARGDFLHEEGQTAPLSGKMELERVRFEFAYMEAAASLRAGLDPRRSLAAKALLAEALRYHQAVKDRFGEARALCESARLRMVGAVERQVASSRWPAVDAETLLSVIEASAQVQAACQILIGRDDEADRELLAMTDSTIVGMAVYDKALLRFGILPGETTTAAMARLSIRTGGATTLLIAEMAYLRPGVSAPGGVPPNESTEGGEEKARSALLKRAIALAAARP